MACSNSKKQKNELFFASYNLVNLEGIDPIKEIKSYPVVSITKDKSEITIRHYLSKDSVIESKYEKIDSAYRRKYELNIGVSSMEFEEFHFHDRIIILFYNTSARKALSSISEYKNDTLTSYSFKNEMESGKTWKEYWSLVNSDKIYSVRKIVFKKIEDEIYINIAYSNIVYPDLSNNRLLKYKAEGSSLNSWLIFKWGFFWKSLLLIDDSFLPKNN